MFSNKKHSLAFISSKLADTFNIPNTKLPPHKKSIKHKNPHLYVYMSMHHFNCLACGIIQPTKFHLPIMFYT